MTLEVLLPFGVFLGILVLFLAALMLADWLLDRHYRPEPKETEEPPVRLADYRRVRARAALGLSLPWDDTGEPADYRRVNEQVSRNPRRIP